MNIEELRQICLSLPAATEDFPFDETTLVFRIQGKIFACVDLNRPDVFVFKCAPDYAVALRDRYLSVCGAWHWNKKYWNQVEVSTFPDSNMFPHFAAHAYVEVVKKLTRRERAELESLPGFGKVLEQAAPFFF